jgi:hypothetical protein
VTKLSDRMATSEYLAVRAWAPDVRKLEDGSGAELDAERLRCQELARMLDDERRGRRNAEAAHASAQHVANGNYDACGQFAAKIRQQQAGIAILHLVYSMREYALRGRIANQRRELRRLNAQITTVESDGMTLRYRDAVAKWQRRADDDRAAYTAVAEALGIMYEGDGCASAPGPVDACVDAIRDLQRYRDKALEATHGYGTATGVMSPLREVTRAPARKDSGVDLSMIIGSRPIPETALEPTDGGGRQEDAVDVIMISMQSRSFDVAGQHTHLCPKCYRHAPCGLTCSVFHENQRDDGTYEASPSECDDCEHGAEDNAVNVPLIHVYMAIGRAQSQGEHEEARVMSKAFDGRPADERFVRMTRDLAKLVRKHYPDDEDLARRRVTERAKPPHPWRMERRAVVAERCDNAACVCRARRADGASLVANALTLASEAHHAPGDGPLHAEWQDKPHRVVYDLCATVRAQADAIADRDARIADLERRLREAEGQIDSAWNASGVAGTVRGLTTLADVISVQRANGDEARRSAAAHAAAADDYRDAFAQAALERDAAIARAERAEATIARVRGLVDGDDDAWARCVLAILDGGKES